MVSHKEKDMTDKSTNFGERKRLFSIAAQTAVSDMLNGKVEIHPDDIQLEIKEGNIGAIFINGRLSNNSNFKKMWMESSCLSELKKIAQKAIEGKL